MFRLEEDVYGAEINDIREIILPQEPTKVPNNPDFIEKLVDKNYGIQGLNISFHNEDFMSYQQLEDICKNIKFLLEKNKLYELRLVCESEWVDVLNTLKSLKECIPDDYKNISLKLITYRNHSSKLRMKDTPTTSVEQMKFYEKYAKDLGYKNIIVR